MQIKPLPITDLPRFLEYLQDHISDNGKDGKPRFLPIPSTPKELPDTLLESLKSGHATPIGSVGWRRVLVATDDKGDFMGHIDLANIRFDTITNHIDLTQGVLSVPSMIIESTIGHYELSGRHDLDHKLEYFVRIPWKTIKEGAKSKLFGKKKVEEVDDRIVERDPNKNIKYLNLKISGTLDNYKVGLGKDRKKK